MWLSLGISARRSGGFSLSTTPSRSFPVPSSASGLAPRRLPPAKSVKDSARSMRLRGGQGSSSALFAPSSACSRLVLRNAARTIGFLSKRRDSNQTISNPRNFPAVPMIQLSVGDSLPK